VSKERAPGETASSEPAPPERGDVFDGPQIIKTKEGLEARINEDGSVTFINLPADLIDLALELDPDAVIACSTDE
jgi:hypothetical protein